MNLPSSIKIGPHTFTIVEVDEHELKDSGDGTVCGDVEIQRLVIRICKEVPLALKLETLAHEVVHAMRGLSRTELKNDEREEDVVQVLGLLLYQFLIENDLSCFRPQTGPGERW